MVNLVFEYDVSGHHLEYLHHIHEYVACNNQTEKFVFVIPKEFDYVKENLEWSDSERISFDYLSDKESERCKKPNLFISAWDKSIILRSYVQKHKADNVLLITLVHFMPFLPFFMPSKTRVRGIIYRVYLYEWTRISFFKKCQEVLKYWLYARSKTIEKPLILNDSSAACYLNKLYKTEKFSYIPDPINITAVKLKDMRPELGIKEGQRMHLHFGGLTKRKGTLLIIEAIGLMNDEELKQHCFVFAGKVHDDIRDEFYSKIEIFTEKGANIKIFDEFCPYELLYNLCYSCDDIIIPYENITQSSGVIGYAAFFGKPVIGPKGGLLGKLIKKYQMGITLKDLTQTSILNAFSADCINHEIDDKYLNNTIDDFSKVLIGC